MAVVAFSRQVQHVPAQTNFALGSTPPSGASSALRQSCGVRSERDTKTDIVNAFSSLSKNTPVPIFLELRALSLGSETHHFAAFFEHLVVEVQRHVGGVLDHLVDYGTWNDPPQ